MTGERCATDALLACASASTRAELHRARLELIACGHGVVRGLDTSLLVAGDGTAGDALLGGGGSTAIRSHRIEVALHAQLADPTDPYALEVPRDDVHFDRP